LKETWGKRWVRKMWGLTPTCWWGAGDCAVDFSSGSNEFLCMLKRKCNAPGSVLRDTCGFVGFDVLPGKFQDEVDFILRDWFEVQAKHVRASPRITPDPKLHRTVSDTNSYL
jgi:hypothetical protein